MTFHAPRAIITPPMTSVADAFAYCENIARSHYENFTVGSAFLPKDRRAHVYNLYAYSRTVDDLGDEAEGDRLKLLDDFEAQLRLCWGGAPTQPLFVALQETIRLFDIPIEPFMRLIEANRMDQRISRYETFADLRHYCRHSADPCGRLFLYVFGYRDAARHELSDPICTALQLTNFWQDVPIDWAKGRVYLPREDLRRFNYAEDDIARQVYDDRFKALLKFEVDRARALFNEGKALLATLDGRAKFDVRLFRLGGMALLDAIEKADYNVYAKRPTISKSGKMALMVAAILGLK